MFLFYAFFTIYTLIAHIVSLMLSINPETPQKEKSKTL